MTSAWTPEHLRGLDPAAAPALEPLAGIDRAGLEPGLLYWDMWPIQQPDGTIARPHGRELWMVLSAPDRGDPALRHFEVKIRLLERLGVGWRDLGPVLPDCEVPYEREWAGSAVTDGDAVWLYFTGAGLRGQGGGYQQALYGAQGRIGADGLPCDWSQPSRLIDGAAPHYMPADAHHGESGKIKAFRDPAFFRDPADGQEYLVFTASLAGSDSEYNGAVGLARRADDGGWSLLPPLIHADRVNNELERAHAVFHQGRYYVFWVTQRHTFEPGLRHAPNGLYGMVADTLFGEYRPLNGTGLVLTNPASEPFSTYSWFVSAELIVSAFVDFWKLEGAPMPTDPAEASRHFGGVPAPLVQLAIDGDRCWIAGSAEA